VGPPLSAQRSAAERLHRHSLTRVTVLDDFRIMFLPIPKSGCTSVLWSLADLAGLSRDRFVASRAAEVSRSMAIHDMTLWEPQHRWKSRSETERQQILDSPDWLRLSIARNPAPRLWSAWQSKILLQEPRFVERFSGEAWFPGRADSVDQVIESFRAFVHALDTDPDDAPHDAHWGPQRDLMAGFDLSWVGRAEDPAATWSRLASHLGPRARIRDDAPRENANPIGYHPCVYDAATADVLNRVYAGDLVDFGYQPLDVAATPDASEWRGQAATRLLLVNELVDRHLRIGELLSIVAEQQHRLQAVRRDAAAAVAEVAAIRASTSWRVTAPLRGLRRPRR